MISDWKSMIAEGKTAKVITQLMAQLEAIDEQDYLNDVISISARQQRLKKDVMGEMITGETARISQNKINNALLFTLDELDDDDILTKETETEAEAEAAKDLPPIENIASLDELKDRAKSTLELLEYLRKEETMTVPGKGLFALQKQIEQAEKDLEEAKDKIKNFSQ